MKREQFLAKYNLEDTLIPITIDASQVNQVHYRKWSKNRKDSRTNNQCVLKKPVAPLTRSNSQVSNYGKKEPRPAHLWIKFRNRIKEAVSDKNLWISNSLEKGKENLPQQEAASGLRKPKRSEEKKHWQVERSQKKLIRGFSRPNIPVSNTSPKYLRRALSMRSLSLNTVDCSESNKPLTLPYLMDENPLISKLPPRDQRSISNTDHFAQGNATTSYIKLKYNQQRTKGLLDHNVSHNARFDRVKEWVENCCTTFDRSSPYSPMFGLPSIQE